MSKVNNGLGLDSAFKAYNTATDRWSKSRDEAVEKASTFGIGPIRFPRGPFTNKKDLDAAYERYQKLEAAANGAFEILKEALNRRAGRE